jgi:hypothetical protein
MAAMMPTNARRSTAMKYITTPLPTITHNCKEHKRLRHGDVLRWNGRTYKAGSAAGYAMEYDECPITAVDRCVRRNHPLHWIIALGAAITSHQQERVQAYEIEIGDVVRFEGRTYEVKRAPNCNLDLVEAGA